MLELGLELWRSSEANALGRATSGADLFRSKGFKTTGCTGKLVFAIAFLRPAHLHHRLVFSRSAYLVAPSTPVSLL